MSQNKDIKGVEQVIDLQKEELIHVIDGKKREEEFKTVQEPDNLLTRFVKGLHNAMFNSIEEKNKPTDEERNMIALNDKIQIEIEEPLKMIFEAILHLVNYEEVIRSEAQPSGPTKSLKLSPAFSADILFVSAPTVWNTIVTVPAVLS